MNRRARTVAEGWIPKQHGTSAYRRGCRCDECRAANTEYQRASGVQKRHRDRNLAQRVMRDGNWYAPNAKHGSHDGYKRFGCRCKPCVDANQAYMTGYRREHAPARPARPARVLTPCGTTSAYKRHLRRGEETCAECRAAVAAYSRNWYRQRGAS